MKSGLTIQKEIMKKEHEASPLGQLEKKIRKIYDNLVIKKDKLPEDIAKKVYDIREENEKWQTDYIDFRLQEDRKAVDEKLFESMSKELELLQSHGY